MKAASSLALAPLMLLLTGSNLFSQPLPKQAWLYTLVEGSQLVDECPVCDRIPIVEPLRGTFKLTFLDDNSLFTRYRVHDIAFVAEGGFGRTYKVTGEGCYHLVFITHSNADLEVFLDALLPYGRCKVLHAMRCVKSHHHSTPHQLPGQIFSQAE